MSRVVAILPARMGSSRFPGKPLARILGMTMIEHVYRRASMSAAVDEVVVATCDEEIARAVADFGGRAIMTSPKHERGTDRVAEAAATLDAGIVVNVQGDEPMLVPHMIDLAVAPLLEDPTVRVCNLITPLPREEQAISDPNAVKAVFDQAGNALYFSRSILPGLRYAPLSYQRYRQLGLYAFRAEFLQTYARLSPTPLESAESVDMLRILEHGLPIRVAISPYSTLSVDTPEELREVERQLVGDELFAKYSGA